MTKVFRGITSKMLVDRDEFISSTELAHKFDSETSQVNAILRFMGFTPFFFSGEQGKPCYWPRFAAINKITELARMRNDAAQRNDASITAFLTEIVGRSNTVSATMNSCDLMPMDGIIFIRCRSHFVTSFLSKIRNRDILNECAKKAGFFLCKLIPYTEA